MKLISIGFGNFVAPERIIAAVDPESNPIKRVVAQARESGKLIDATFGRKTKTVLVMDSDHVILCPLEPEEVSRRAAGETGGETNEAR
ncbi:MAG: DUF370 domain-containing protein [Oscillospiraceae bacterium]|nr:DUF370 domain-containing protein [Oscillospiraceae bacterium]